MRNFLLFGLSELIKSIFPVSINIFFALDLNQSNSIPFINFGLKLPFTLLFDQLLVLLSLAFNLFEQKIVILLALVASTSNVEGSVEPSLSEDTTVAICLFIYGLFVVLKLNTIFCTDCFSLNLSMRTSITFL